MAILGGSIWLGDRLKQSRESARPLPSPGSPNVLLIVLDTVAAGHLNLHGYHRATSTTLAELAERGSDSICSGVVVMDAAISCDNVYRTMVARALGRLAHPARPGMSYAGGIPERTGLRHGWIRWQHDVLCSRLGASPRLHTVPRFRLSRADRAKTAVLVRRALDGLQSVAGNLADDWLAQLVCYRCSSESGNRLTLIVRERRSSIASSSIGSRNVHSRSGRFSLF